MGEAVVGAVVGATIQVVVQNLLSISVEEISLIRDFKKDLEKLKNSFLMIQDFLEDAEVKQFTNKAVKRWLKNLEALAFEADNILDELNYEVLRKKMETKNKLMKKKVRSFFSNSNPIGFRWKITHEIRDTNKKLELINQEASGFGLQRLVDTHTPNVGSEASTSLETDSFTVDPIFLGRDNDVSRIVEMLTTNSTEQVFSILPIVGMGGLGKTTLVRKVYGDGKIISCFGNRVWVHVSENFDPIIIFRSILASLTTENFVLGSREVLLKMLQKSLGAKRYLLVLDNVWNEEMEKWDSFIDSLAGISSAKGNGIIVTTKSASVASIVKTLDLHQLEGLSEYDCWSIIKAKAFGEGPIPSEFETMGKNIARRCGGLPLAAKVVGGLLRGKLKDEWLSIEKTWLSDFGGDENIVTKTLKLSFDHLPSPSLKKCFAYCSIMPKGYYIDRDELIELWMAEGFLQTDSKSDFETVGRKFFNLLLQNSLLQLVETDGYGHVKYCNMHDLVHDLACSILNPKLLDDIYPVRYIGGTSDGVESSAIPKEQAKYLRTLFFKGQVSYTIFSDFKSLHVLTLIGDDVIELPSSISKLIHLRCLDISYTRITCLPDSIGELYLLQTLRAVRKYEWEMNYLSKLPSTLKYLISLRHLHIPNIELPPEVGRLTSLQTLPYFEVGDEKCRGIIELGSLKNLKGELEIYNLENVHDKEEAQSANLFQKPSMFKLKFVWSKFREGETNDENVLEGLQPHPNLKILKIYGYNGRSFPLWTWKMAVRDDHLPSHWVGLNNLMEITLSGCKECEEIPVMGHLPHLKSLCLHDLTNVRSIGSSFYGIHNCSPDNGICKETTIVFPSLERLELSGMSNMTEWVEVELLSAEVVIFPCLGYLKITNCRQLMNAPSHFPSLKELEIYEMDNDLPLANTCGIKLTSLKKLKIERIDGMTSLPDWLFYNNQNLSEFQIISCPSLTHLVPCLGGGGASLRELKIVSCSNLRELPDDLHSLNSLEKFLIYSCPNLRSIPYPSGGQSQGFTSLRCLEIGRCPGLTHLPSEMVESCALSLESLILEESSSLINLPMVIGCLQKIPRSTSLKLFKVLNFTNFVLENDSVHNLQELSIGYSPYSLDLVSFMVTLNGIFQRLLSLISLSLYGMEHWDTLPDQLQNLTALSWLGLHDFGIEALPEWFDNLSSLKTLYLSRCKKLRGLPSKQAMQCLKKLTMLQIYDCPLLKRRCIEQQTDDSEWHKISHIPYVDVDGRRISSHAEFGFFKSN